MLLSTFKKSWSVIWCLWKFSFGRWNWNKRRLPEGFVLKGLLEVCTSYLTSTRRPCIGRCKFDFLQVQSTVSDDLNVTATRRLLKGPCIRWPETCLSIQMSLFEPFKNGLLADVGQTVEIRKFRIRPVRVVFSCTFSDIN